MAGSASFSSRLGFILATAGMAVGLGNIWSFPFVAGQNGGGGFVLIYLITMALIAAPIMMAELTLGRLGRNSPPKALANLGEGRKFGGLWPVPAFVGMFSLIIIVSFYAVIAGQSLSYLLESAKGTFSALDGPSITALDQDYKAQKIAPFLWSAFFLGITGWIATRGVEKGIERAAKIMMPAFFLLLLSLVIFSMIKGDGAAALSFLFSFEKMQLTPDIILQAVGQAFFSVSVGVGGVMAYGAYMGRDVSLPGSTFWIVLLDTAVALLAGLMIFPLVFAEPSVQPDAGPNLIFITLPIVFSLIPFGSIVAVAFFLLLAFAALTSSISMLAPGIQWLEDKGWPRSVAGILLTIIAIALSSLTVLSFNDWSTFYPLAPIGFDGMTIFDLFREGVNNIVLPLGGLAFAVMVGWGMDRSRILQAFGVDHVRLMESWLWLLRYVVPIAIVAMFLNIILG